MFRFDEAAGQLVVLNARKVRDRVGRLQWACGRGQRTMWTLAHAFSLRHLSLILPRALPPPAGGLRPEQIVSAAMAALTALLDNVVNAASTLPGGSQ